MSVPASHGSTSRTITPIGSDDDLALDQITSTPRPNALGPATVQGGSAATNAHASNQYNHYNTPVRSITATGSSILHMPYEIVSYIVQALALETIYDLSQSCRRFQYLIKDENICKMLLRVSQRQTAFPKGSQLVLMLIILQEQSFLFPRSSGGTA